MPIDSTRDLQRRNSPELDEVISKPPPAIIAWGIGTITVIIMVLVALGGYLEYPTFINAPIHLNEEANGQLTASAQIAERDISKIKSGQLVYVHLNALADGGNNDLRAAISTIDTVVGKNGIISVKVTGLPNTSTAGEPALLPGMSGEAKILISRASLLHRVTEQFIHLPK
ncbi:hypothetical protein DYU05_06340 [Mucilaginibacter terrenus]|uniref:HlyD family secretion protein n=1 Tax=Mucilaginibacter terrenus TaxID=2482727 RepID=A0A3E2NW75_9SPHI|nr:hypothetical protein [Mucilaginibacter terrenus]RFZ85217.1 hypothetical protein DYU05_06340 [Mucilaginibacter terrenus]